MKLPKQLQRETIIESQWVNHYVDQVEMPAGKIIEQHHILSFANQGVAAIVENQQKEIILINSYRYTISGMSWELPAGNTELNEDILLTAKREVLEETGYDSTDHELIYSYYPMVGISDKQFHCVKCKAGSKISSFDPDEVFEVVWFKPSEILELVSNRQIIDGLTLSCLLLHLK